MSEDTPVPETQGVNTLEFGETLLPENNVMFHIQEDDETVEVLRISPDGFYVRGERVDDKYQVYAAFVDWMQQANPTFYKDPEVEESDGEHF